MAYTKNDFKDKATRLIEDAYHAGWVGGIKRMEGAFPSKPEKITPMSLLERFVDLYGEEPLAGEMIQPGRRLWRDYYEFTGTHMVLTEEGWEPGEVKQSYLDACGPEAILDEVNCPS